MKQALGLLEENHEIKATVKEILGRTYRSTTVRTSDGLVGFVKGRVEVGQTITIDIGHHIVNHLDDSDM